MVGISPSMIYYEGVKYSVHHREFVKRVARIEIQSAADRALRFMLNTSPNCFGYSFLAASEFLFKH